MTEPADTALRRQLRAGLAALDADARRRVARRVEDPSGPWVRVDGRDRLAFASNDYLGLAAEPELARALADGAVRWGAGAGAAHLVSGHSAAHEALERELAAFVGRERALLCATGYQANLGIMPALVGRNDEIFADRLNHASLIDGARLSRARVTRYRHADLDHLARLLSASRAPRKLIVTDTIFSMDGDLAPLAGLAALAEQHDAWLVLDDAHGFGVFGPQGRGCAAEAGIGGWRVLTMGTLGKAAGVAGAFVAGDAEVIDWLQHQARSFLFTTAQPPALAEALRMSLRLIEHGDARRTALAERIAQWRAHVAQRGWRVLPSDSAIQPLIIGDNAQAMQLSAALFEAGFWVPAIRPPTVPKGTARLRVSLSAAHRQADLAALLAALDRLLDGTAADHPTALPDAVSGPAPEGVSATGPISS